MISQVTALFGTADAPSLLTVTSVEPGDVLRLVDGPIENGDEAVVTFDPFGQADASVTDYSARTGNCSGDYLPSTDAASDGRDKMRNTLRGYEAHREDDAAGYQIPHFELLSAEQIGLALGLENVIHAALTKGAAAQSALARAERLARYMAN